MKGLPEDSGKKACSAAIAALVRTGRDCARGTRRWKLHD